MNRFLQTLLAGWAVISTLFMSLVMLRIGLEFGVWFSFGCVLFFGFWSFVLGWVYLMLTETKIRSHKKKTSKQLIDGWF